MVGTPHARTHQHAAVLSWHVSMNEPACMNRHACFEYWLLMLLLLLLANAQQQPAAAASNSSSSQQP
jgi:hypothetical protein